MSRLFAHLVLMRPANIVTAVADILLGFAASGSVLLLGDGPVTVAHPQLRVLAWLVVATVGLYGGGVVFNDVFDAELDRIERPERPIPSGAASRASASVLGTLLLLGGIGAAFQVSRTSGLIAAAIAVLALAYDAVGKHHAVLGPLNMGACRGGNLLLGLSAVPAAVSQLWYLALIPVVYIAAITAISRGEVHGGDKRILLGSVGLYGLVIGAILVLTRLPQVRLWPAVPFLALFSYLIFPPLLKAIGSLQPLHVRRAVKAGVMALILLDATVAAGFAGWAYGLGVLALFPLSRWLAGHFAVT
ncbi:UbiA prenyltransferase [Hymenobacter roseosalivarius DSM 11622]|uniref:UbiA prenyltransferase n=1 Tax=Hymenobacter roseosalivarius DSM 11622 TaxID=645990 RepID=A0A1W1W1Q4_9BACT|nr:UbiA-like protein EboC [Hymenobacter roseosalivarius]SMB99557.1 UbiA prenyltransferase [Hymenobacter roseosalivarius DSM 11622]